MSSFILPQRRPLGNRHLQGAPNVQSQPFGKEPRVVSGSKRARSSDHPDVSPAISIKRARSIQATQQKEPLARDLQKERRHAERDQKAAEFKEKYTRAFPSWKFYMDSENINQSQAVQNSLKSKIIQLQGSIEIYFSSSITHLITDLSVTNNEKENSHAKPTSSKGASLKSPIKLVGRADGLSGCSVVDKAVEYGIKIWSTSKLDSVLSRCLDSPPTKFVLGNRIPGAIPRSNNLSLLLQTEKIHGSTERDPTQKRHDYRYFTKGSCFVLVEDLHQELATIAAHEYPIYREKDKSAKKPWPVLHCHPLSRNPFIPFDDREKRRWERNQQQLEAGQLEEAERQRKRKEIEVLKRKAEAHSHAKKHGDLRRSASLNNMHRRHSYPETGHKKDYCVDLDDDYDSADVSGYIASGYIAASGNSVGITSTTGTTSTSTQGQRSFHLPNAIMDRMKQHVVTFRKVSTKEKGQNDDTPQIGGVMGPPAMMPNKQIMLKKSKSTNTLKLPKREEGSKPGYCESCRMKFSDFATHTESKKHRKFATNPANFCDLDIALERLRRKTRVEMEKYESKIISRHISLCKAANSRNIFFASRSSP